VSRRPPQPAERIDRSTTITFSFDGEPVQAYAGDTIGSALFAAGRRTFSRSFKYHRRRGLMCCAGHCPNCLVAVDGAPGIRACTEPARDGARVAHMNARPSLERDAMAITDAVGGPFTPPGFYYKTFIRPRRLWPLFEPVLRNAAGLGRLPDKQTERTLRSDYRRRHADVLVIGAGLVGLTAAIEAASDGSDVVLVDEGAEPGGRLLWEGDVERARELSERARELGVEILVNAPALGAYDGLVAVWQGATLHQIRSRRQIYATGAIEQPLVFAGNDLPGVMLSGGALRLAQLYSVLPGRRAVVATVSDRGIDAALALRDMGVEIAAVADLRRTPSAVAHAASDAGLELMHGWTVGAAEGRRQVERVWLTTLSAAAGSGVRTIQCDLLVVSGGDAPLGQTISGQGIDEVFEAAPPAPRVPRRRGKAFTCFCEDVTAKDIERGVAEGYDSIELCKRFTTASMGPCQGRMCKHAAIRQVAVATGTTPGAVGTTTARPPWSTVPMGVLAGRPFEPEKRSPLHGRHVALGAAIRWAGDWKRAYDYGDVDGEALAVHRAAGLIDVSTLGKLLVRGPDAGAFLDRLYPTVMSSLAPGRIRYGVLTSDAGRIMDDGTIARLDEETFYVTTTSGGAGAVEQWFSRWLADWGLDVELTDVTQALAAVNIAGPQSREILARVTALDLAPRAFGYLDCRQAVVASVNALLLRIGFTGELGYELHLPAAHAEHVWDTLLAAGSGDGLRPVGLEPQRILRLQKQHVLVGQDTDSESTPLNAGMPWAVKLDRPEPFIGRWALERASASSALVGFTMANGATPREGAVVLDPGGAAAGQVTSVRCSRQLGRVIGMAWVPAELAADGASITILDEGCRLHASVVTAPFHDPDGTRVRS
jgi:sarcosine oxidase, subunit alpha